MSALLIVSSGASAFNAAPPSTVAQTTATRSAVNMAESWKKKVPAAAAFPTLSLDHTALIRGCHNIIYVVRAQVVVTGLGTFTSLGNDPDTFFNNLLDGKCGIGPVTRFDTADSVVKIASEVKDFDVSKYWDMKDAKR